MPALREDIIDLSSSPLAESSKSVLHESRKHDHSTESTTTEPQARNHLPHSQVLAGKTFVLIGTFLTMTAEGARELCEANGG